MYKNKSGYLILMTILMLGILSQPLICDESNTILLESIGHFSGQTLYLTYISIGTIADGHAKEVYNDATTDELLGKSIGLCSGSVAQLNKLLSSGVLSGEDITYVSGLIDTFNLLSAQASGYRNYVKTGDANHVQVFTAKRKAAWKNISELLGIKE